MPRDLRQAASLRDSAETRGKRGPKTIYLAADELAEWRLFVRTVLKNSGVGELDIVDPDREREDERWIQRALYSNRVSTKVARAIVAALGDDDRTWKARDRLYIKLRKSGGVRRWFPHATDDKEMERLLAYLRDDWANAEFVPIAIVEGDEAGLSQLLVRVLSDCGAIKPSKTGTAVQELTEFFLCAGNAMRLHYLLRDNTYITSPDVLEVLEDLRKPSQKRRGRAKRRRLYFCARVPRINEPCIKTAVQSIQARAKRRTRS